MANLNIQKILTTTATILDTHFQNITPSPTTTIPSRIFSPAASMSSSSSSSSSPSSFSVSGSPILTPTLVPLIENEQVFIEEEDDEDQSMFLPVNSLTSCILDSVMNEDFSHSHRNWAILNESNLPNLIDSLLNTHKGRYSFELLMVSCGYFDARLFSADNGPDPSISAELRKELNKSCDRGSMLLLNKVCDRNATYHHRDQASLELLDRLKLIQSEQTTTEEKRSEMKLLEKLNIVPTHYSKYSDILIRIFGNYCLQIASQNTGSFLIQHLFLTCTLNSKIYLTQLMLSEFERIVVNRSGNYMLKLVLEWLCGLEPSGKCIVSHKYENLAENVEGLDQVKMKYWEGVSYWTVENIHRFFKLACHPYGSFVMKLIVMYLSYGYQQTLLNQLAEYNYIQNLSGDRYGKFVIQALKSSFREKKYYEC